MLLGLTEPAELAVSGLEPQRWPNGVLPQSGCPWP